MPPALGDEEHLTRLEQTVNIRQAMEEGEAFIVGCV